MSLDVRYQRENESRLRNVAVNRPRSRDLRRRRHLWRRSQTTSSAYLEGPCSRFGILDHDLSLIGANYRKFDCRRIVHATWAGEAHPDEVSGSFFGNRVDSGKDVED